LKQIADCLGLSTQGRKLEMVERILCHIFQLKAFPFMVAKPDYAAMRRLSWFLFCAPQNLNFLKLHFANLEPTSSSKAKERPKTKWIAPPFSNIKPVRTDAL
jgi:hypothetical protein